MTEQPEKTASRRHRWSPRGDRGLKARGPFFFLLALAAVSLLLHVEKSRRNGQARAAGKKYAALVDARPIDRIRAERTRFYETRYFLGYPTTVSFAVADFLLRLARLAPPLQLRGVQVDAGLLDLRFKLTVGVSGGRPREVRRRLDAFLGRLRLVPTITSVDLSGPGPTARGGGVRIFTVGGRAELQP